MCRDQIRLRSLFVGHGAQKRSGGSEATASRGPMIHGIHRRSSVKTMPAVAGLSELAGEALLVVGLLLPVATA